MKTFIIDYPDSIKMINSRQRQIFIKSMKIHYKKYPKNKLGGKLFLKKCNWTEDLILF